MKKQTSMVKVCSLLLVFSLCFASGALAAVPLQATLSATEGGWTLRSVALDGGNVDLASGKWLGEKAAGTCYRGFFGISNGDCKEVDFVSARPSGNNIIAVPIMWPLGLLVGVLSAPSGQFDDSMFFPIVVDRKYSSQKFQAALAAAIDGEGGQERLSGLLTKADRVMADAEEGDQTLATARGEVESFSDAMLGVAAANFDLKVVDKSGFWQGGDLLSGQGDVRFELQPLEVPSFANSFPGAQEPCRTAVKEALFPSDTVADFAQKLPQAAELGAKVRATHEAELAALRATLGRRNATVLLEDTGRLASRLKGDGFAAQTSLPERMQIAGGVVTAGGRGTVTILNRTFRDVLPDSYSYSNNDLSLALEGRSIKITNKTKSYVSLDALTLYHNNDVLTLGSESLREISPDTVITIQLDRFALKSLKTDYPELTRDKARSTRIDFGFACKYRRNDLTQARSFVEIKPYNLLDLLKQRDLVAKR